jgi:hypothetical protein
MCLLDERGELLVETAVAPDADGLRGLARRLAGLPVRAVIESMSGARFVPFARFSVRAAPLPAHPPARPRGRLCRHMPA